MLDQFHQCIGADVKMSELHGTVEEMAVPSAPETDALKRIVMNLTDVHMTDAHNQTGFARAPLEPGYHWLRPVIALTSSPLDAQRWNLPTGGR